MLENNPNNTHGCLYSPHLRASSNNLMLSNLDEDLKLYIFSGSTKKGSI